MYSFKNFKLICSFLVVSVMSCNAHWTVLLYMEAMPDLHDKAVKIISEIMDIKSNEDVRFCIQLHSFGDVALRFVATECGMKFVEETTLSGVARVDFIRAAEWAYGSTSVDQSMLIFNGYGYGCLDPDYKDSNSDWFLDSSAIGPTRGFMFNPVAGSYLTYYDMSQAFEEIKQTILKDGLDIVAFDAFMGGTVEGASLYSSYAKYLIGSQANNLKNGFYYKALLKSLKQEKSPIGFMNSFIRSLNSYYMVHDRSGSYAFTALDLSKVKQVESAFLALNEYLLESSSCIGHIKEAAESAFPPRDTHMYADFFRYLESLEYVLCLYGECNKELIEKISNLKQAVVNMVVNKCAGFQERLYSNGCALYLPITEIHHSYVNIEFAYKTLWLSVLESLLKV